MPAATRLSIVPSTRADQVRTQAADLLIAMSRGKPSCARGHEEQGALSREHRERRLTRRSLGAPHASSPWWPTKRLTKVLGTTLLQCGRWLTQAAWLPGCLPPIRRCRPPRLFQKLFWTPTKLEVAPSITSPALKCVPRRRCVHRGVWARRSALGGILFPPCRCGQSSPAGRPR